MDRLLGKQHVSVCELMAKANHIRSTRLGKKTEIKINKFNLY